MAYSYVTYTGNGSTTQFAVTFPYIRKEHVYVTVDAVNTAYTWVNDSLIQLASAPANGKEVIVRRVTPVASRLVDYTDGSTLVAADLDTDSLQHLYTEQELTDNVGPVADLRGVYFGVYTSDPTQSPFGQPLQAGDLYYNNTLQTMRVYTGSQWKNATGASVITRFVYTLTTGQSSVSGADLVGSILAYTPGLEMVFVNGIALSRGFNYTATNGTSITGLTIATTTKVEVFAISPLDSVNSISGSSIADNTITSAKIENGTLANIDISNSAAIAYSKLSLANSILNADVNSSAAIAYSKLNLASSILDADINSAAGIAHSKLASLTSGRVLLGNASNVPTATALTGAIAVSNTGVTTLGSGVVGASNLVVGAGTSGQYLSTNGSQIVWASAEQRLETSAVNASGTVVEITGVPSWAKEIIVDYQDLNTTTATPCSIRVGSSGGYQPAGAYFGKVRSQSSIQDLNAISAPGFRLTTAAWAGNTYYLTGSLSIKQSGYSWIAVGQGALTNAISEMYFTAGFVSSFSSLATWTKIQFYIDGSANVSVTYRVTYKG